jgi:putative transposon-encoded protein
MVEPAAAAPQAQPDKARTMKKIETQQAATPPGPDAVKGKFARRKAKFEVFGEEMIEKQVKQSGASGRIYLPPEWVGKCVKVIRLA